MRAELLPLRARVESCHDADACHDCVRPPCDAVCTSAAFIKPADCRGDLRGASSVPAGNCTCSAGGTYKLAAATAVVAAGVDMWKGTCPLEVLELVGIWGGTAPLWLVVDRRLDTDVVCEMAAGAHPGPDDVCSSCVWSACVPCMLLAELCCASATASTASGELVPCIAAWRGAGAGARPSLGTNTASDPSSACILTGVHKLWGVVGGG